MLEKSDILGEIYRYILSDEWGKKKDHDCNYQEQKQERQRTKAPDIVYKMKTKSGLFKVGVTSNIERRRKDHALYIGEDVEVVFWIRVDPWKIYDLEKRIIHRYEDMGFERIRKTEWFKYV